MAEFAGLFRPPSLSETYTDERCFITEQLNTPDCPEVSLATCRVEPGVTTQLHQLKVQERYVVQSGQGLMELDAEQVFEVGPGDCVVIPAGCPQRIKNTGAGDLVFLCVCTPRFKVEHYVDLETAETSDIEPNHD